MQELQRPRPGPLDIPTVPLKNGTREELEGKIDTHVLATARLVGMYQRRPVAATR